MKEDLKHNNTCHKIYPQFILMPKIYLCVRVCVLQPKWTTFVGGRFLRDQFSFVRPSHEALGVWLFKVERGEGGTKSETLKTR